MHRLTLTKRESFDAVKNYRSANAPVAEIWEAYNDAAVAAVETGREFEAGKCKFSVSNGFLWIELPSGRKLAYREPSITYRAITYTALEKDEKGEDIEVEKVGREKKTVQFLGLDKSKKRLQVEFTHGGILAENITQAVARDIMMLGLLRLEKSGYKVLLSVYDEGVSEKPFGEGSAEEFVSLLCQVPPWGEGLPLKANGWSGPRYRK